MNDQHWITESRQTAHGRIVAALSSRARELRDLPHSHCSLDANGREKIADIVVDALFEDVDCGCFHLPKHNPDCPQAERA